MNKKFFFRGVFTAMFVFVLQVVAEPSSRVEFKDDDIFIAIAADDKDTLCAILMDDGTKIMATHTDGMMPLHYAASLNRLVLCHELLRFRANPNSTIETNLTTALHWAANANAVEAAQILLKNGADVSARALNGFTALHFAARNGSENLIRSLVYAKADVNARDLSGRTPLHIASQAGNAETVRALIKYGANRNMRDNNNYLPSQFAATPEVRALLPRPVKKQAKPKVEPAPEPVEVVPAVATTDSVASLIKILGDESRPISERLSIFLANSATRVNRDGSAYNGNLDAKGRPEGFGIYLANKDDIRERYEGAFSAGRRSGEGTYRYQNGDVITVTWRNDAPDGLGTFETSNGCRIQGEWRLGKLYSGTGSYKTVNGKTVNGVWERGVLVSKNNVD